MSIELDEIRREILSLTKLIKEYKLDTNKQFVDLRKHFNKKIQALIPSTDSSQRKLQLDQDILPDDLSTKMSDNENRLNDLTGKEWVKSTKSWFTLAVKPRTKTEIDHPAKYPIELAERFIEFFTQKNHWVIDPFLGIGSTLLACEKLERNGVGIEIDQKYAAAAHRNFSQQTLTKTSVQNVICGDSNEIDELLSSFDKTKFNFCMTSPPYWNMLKKHRGGSDSQHKDRKEMGLPLDYRDNSKDNLGNIDDYNTFILKLADIFRKLKKFMLKGSYLVVVLQNIRNDDNEYLPLAWDFAKEMEKHYALKQEQIWCQTDKKLGIWGYPTTYVSNVHHHYCLIFQTI